MKFSILQQDFFPSLSSVARSIGVRSTLPVLGNILISAEKGKLKLSATNLEIGVVKKISAEIIEEGEVTVPAKTLVEMVGNLTGEKLEFSSDGQNIEISTPTFSSTLNGISASEFPSIPLSGKEAVIIETEVLVKSLPKVTFAAAADDSRPILTGILLEIKGKKLQLVATDGYRLAHKLVPTGESALFRALVPRRTLEEVIRLILEEKNILGGEPDGVKIATSDDGNQMVFSFGTTQVSTRLIDGQFPAWEKIIPENFKARVIVDREEFLKAVKLASVLARSEANVVKLQNKKDKLILSSEAKELGSQKKEIEASAEGEELEIAFNTKFLQDVLTAATSGQVSIELSGNLSAAMFKPVGEEDLSYIIMPVNL